MKKFFAMILAAILCVSSLALFVGCGDNDKSKVVGAVYDVSGGLQYDVKYVYRESVRSEDPKNYYKFNADGTGVYSSYGYNYYPYITEIYFKYTYADAQHTGIVCFFDSYKRIWNYDSEEPAVSTEPSEDDKKWYVILSISKDIVMGQGTYGMLVYVNENYIEQIPNYALRSEN